MKKWLLVALLVLLVLPSSANAYGTCEDSEFGGNPCNDLFSYCKQGAYNGLDADKLDGKHAYQFADAYHTHSTSDSYHTHSQYIRDNYYQVGNADIADKAIAMRKIYGLRAKLRALNDKYMALQARVAALEAQ